MSNRRRQGDQVQFKAKQFRAFLLDAQLTFPAPYLESGQHPDGFVYWWKLMQAVLALPSPYDFPCFPDLTGITGPELRVLNRYVSTCEELSESTLLSHRGGVTINVKDAQSEPEIVADLPSAEALRGAAVLFRQLHSADEPASYGKARRIIGRQAHEAGDLARDRRISEQRAWNRAHARLGEHLLTSLADRLVAERMGHRGPPGSMPGENVKPQQILSLFLYGGLIHWDRRAEDYEALVGDELRHKLSTVDFMEVLIQLSHFYLGYAVLVRAALGRL